MLTIEGSAEERKFIFLDCHKLRRNDDAEGIVIASETQWSAAIQLKRRLPRYSFNMSPQTWL